MGRLMQPTAEVQLQPPGAPGPLVAGGGPNMYDMDDFYKNEHSFAHSFVSLYHGAARPTPLLRPRHIPRTQSVCVHSPCHGLVGPRLHPSTPGRFACYTPPPRDFLICRRCYPDWVRSLLMSPLPLEVPLVSSYVPEVVQYGPRGAGVVQGANVAILQH